MANVDIKNALVRFTDGRLGTFVQGDLTITDKSTHRGSKPPVSIEFTGGGVAGAEVVTVTGTAISVQIATGDSTPAQVKTAIEADAAANALVTVTDGGATAVVIAGPTDLANGARTLTIKVGEGNLSYTETKAREYIKDRGKLDLVRDGDEEPVDVSLDLVWEFIQAEAGSGTPTPEDTLKQRGEAAAWVTTGADACEPFSIDVEVEYDPNCGAVKREFITFEEFRYESIDHDLRGGTLSLSGKSNKLEASIERIT